MEKQKSNLMVIFFFIILFVAILLHTLQINFNPYDEIWNFQSVFKMYQGGILYQDNNVIHTPLFFVLSNLAFHLFGANLLVFRIYGTVIFLLKYILLFFILKKLRVTNALSILYLTIWFMIDIDNTGSGANYNQLALVFCLSGILWYVTHYHKKFYHLGQGLLIFLVFFTKQNIGVYYALGIVLFELLEHGFDAKFCLHQFVKLASFLPCLLISAIVMYVRGNLLECINLCFGSLLEFGNTNRVFNLQTLGPLIVMVFITVFSLYILVKSNISKTIKNHIKFLLCLASFLSLTILPIINPYHTIMALLFYYLLFIYTLDRLLLQEIFSIKIQKYILPLICFSVFSIIFARIIYVHFAINKDLKGFDSSSPFYNAPISETNLTQINDTTNYILSKKEAGTDVIILAYDAAAYMVPLRINHREFDLLLSGNLGYHGIQNTIDKISNMQNTEFLIFTDEENCFYQEPKEIRNYILNNLEKNGEFLDYSIYINK